MPSVDEKRDVYKALFWCHFLLLTSALPALLQLAGSPHKNIGLMIQKKVDTR